MNFASLDFDFLPKKACPAVILSAKFAFTGQLVCKFRNLPLDWGAQVSGEVSMPRRTIFFDDNQDTTLGGRVFQAREAAGMSVAQVINRLGVRKATYMAWEADRSEPRANKLVALAGILNVSPTYLLSGLGRATPQPPMHQQIIDELRIEIEQLDQTLKAANKMLSRIKSQAKKFR